MVLEKGYAKQLSESLFHIINQLIIMKKIFLFSISILFFTSCGTTGHIVFYDFSASKYDVQNAIVKVLSQYPQYEVPSKWSNVDKGDYFERMYIYFKNPPEELYRIGFTGDSSTWKSESTSRLGIVSHFDGEVWRNERDLSNKEKERIQNRFESEILSKLLFKYNKTY